MATSAFQTQCLALVVAAAALAANPALADKPSWAGNPHGGKNQQDQPWPDRRDYSDRGRYDRENDRRDWNGDRRYRDQQDSHHAEHRDDRRYEGPRYSGGQYFSDQHRTSVYNYYHDEYRGGRCPPGLAKKHNGCMPPGQARKWAIGRPLPRNVIYYDVPPPVLAGLGYPPPGYRFVRVASDILMIAIGTGLVKDAIYDLGGGW